MKRVWWSIILVDNGGLLNRLKNWKSGGWRLGNTESKTGWQKREQSGRCFLEKELELDKDVERKKKGGAKKDGNWKNGKGGEQWDQGLKVCVCRNSDGRVRVSPAAAVASWPAEGMDEAAPSLFLHTFPDPLLQRNIIHSINSLSSVQFYEKGSTTADYSQFVFRPAPILG